MRRNVTLITGTSQGIGQFLAKWYTKAGHEVIGCSRNAISHSILNYQHIVADVTNEKDIVNVIKEIKKNYGKLDNLINNAGVAAMNHALLTPYHTVKKIMDTNVMGTFLFCREAAKIMSKNKYGRIVNFSTVATPLKLKGEAIYAASKAAVISLTQILAYEFAEYGITVNAIGPTPIETALISAVPETKLNELISRQAIKRYGHFFDVANVIDFYLKRSSEFVTGQTIYLGGVS